MNMIRNKSDELGQLIKFQSKHQQNGKKITNRNISI